jgi:transketolase
MGDPLVHLICGDIGFGLYDKIRTERPMQWTNVGVIEQSMIGIAAGMALAGMKPWVFTITPFLIERPFEQVKIDIDANNSTVKLVGYADYFGQGVSHAMILDFQKHNPFTNIRVYYPKNSQETVEAVLKESELDGPCFISLKKDRPCA